MAKFRVVVSVTTHCEYTVEVEANNESHAQDVACARDIFTKETPERFPDAGDCEFKCETEQLTFECEDCGAPVSTLKEFNEQDFRCKRCLDLYNITHNVIVR